MAAVASMSEKTRHTQTREPLSLESSIAFARATVPSKSENTKHTQTQEALLLKCYTRCRPDYWAESTTKQVHDGWIEQIEMVQDLGGLVTCGADSSITIFEYPFKVCPFSVSLLAFLLFACCMVRVLRGLVVWSLQFYIMACKECVLYSYISACLFSFCILHGETVRRACHMQS